MRRRLSELQQREPLLMYATWVSVACAVASLLLMVFDSQTILGINRWIKPAKFFVSVAIYFPTLAWLFALLDRRVRWIRGAIVLAMMAELVLLTTQVARGRRSHFNEETPFDAIVFAVMGLFIVVNTVAIVALFVQFFRRGLNIRPSLLLAVRLGLLVFLAGSLEAGFMLRAKSHTVGAPDGGAGLPFVNWSREYGDLRIAHFLGLHALQAFPLAALLFARVTREERRRLAAVAAFAIVYVITMSWLLVSALQGSPLLRL